MGSTSLGAASGSGDSLIGLKFGQKIYFEDVGGGGTASASSASASASASAGSSSAAAASAGEVLATSGKKGRGATQGSQPPRCQVEGCQVDLTGAKAYYCRHKVCGMHSKSPMVIVAGLEQRFCQQCSRFHQLREFDQGKRSCRRRLAGHNERRRKPPPGSFVAPHHARIGSSFHEDTSKVGSFLDFSYSRLPGRDVWPPLRVAEHGASSQLTSTGKYLPNLFQGGYGVSTSNIVSHAAQSYLQGSSVGTMFPGAEIPAGEALAGVSGSGCALSLLSNQQWDPRSRGSSLNNLMNDGRTHTHTSQTTSHAPVPTQFISHAWGFKEHGGGGSSNNLNLQQVQGSSNSQFSAAREFPQHEGRQYLDPGQSRGHESSSHQMNWSL